MDEERWDWVTPGIPDEEFARGERVPLTKMEVRVLALAALRPRNGEIIYDIGAGTGGFTLELARLCPQSRIFAIEGNPRAQELIAINVRRFQRANVEMVPGFAPEALAPLPPPQRVLLGGSGGRLQEILAALLPRLPLGGRVVGTAITLDTLYNFQDFLHRQPSFSLEISCINVARLAPLGKKRAFRALNPVYIMATERMKPI